MIQKQKAILCVYLLFIKDDRILLARRQNTPYLNGHYTVPTGHVDTVVEGNIIKNEKTTLAVIREGKEETDATIGEGDFELVLTQIKPSTDVPEPRICLYFRINSWSGQLVNTEPDKADQFGFYPLGNLPGPLLPELDSALKAIQEGRRFDEYGWN